MGKGKKPAARRGALWRRSRPGLSPGLIALIALAGVAVAAGGWLLEREASGAPAQPQGLQLNEIMADNASMLVTEDGEVPDWIEVRNAGSEPVELRGWSLLLGAQVNQLFAFPSGTLQPGECAVVYAEGLYAGARHGDWSAPFRLNASGGETLMLLSPQDAVADSVDLPELSMDESYARAADGSWERRSTATPGADNDAPGSSGTVGVRISSGEVELSEVSTENTLYFADENGEYYDYIEVHNISGRDVNLAGWFLSDASSKLKRWAFPRVILPADGYLAVHCSGYDRTDDPQHLHTDFRLGPGESVYLSRPEGRTVSVAVPPVLLSDQAWSLVNGSWSTELAPSPGAQNSPEGAARVNAATFGGAGVRLNEIMASSVTELYDWLEICNPTAQEIDLSGYGLSDNSARPRKWRFPEGTHLAPGQYLSILLSGGAQSQVGDYLNTDFSLAAAGGYTVTLADVQGRVIDAAYVPQQYGGISYGRAEGEEGFFYFETATPHEANSGAHYRGRAGQAECSSPGGLFQAGQISTVELSAPAGDRIYYTLDCSDPTEASTPYTGPIQITGTTILRSRVYRDGCMPSIIDTQSYLYDVDNPANMYVASLVSDPSNLNGASGILSEDNLMQEIEKEGHMELFTADGATALSQGCGISLHGMDSRREPIKSFNVIARSAYGTNRFNYPIFSDRDYESYHSFLLRPSGEDQNMSYMRDSVLSALMANTSVMYQECEPTVLYINGEYYAMLYLRERINKYSVCQFEGWEGMEGDIDLVRGNKTVLVGSDESFQELLGWVQSNDMTTDEAFAYLDAHIDVQNYIEYMAMQVFSGNSDTLNVRRYRNSRRDGKWRWALFDLDWAFFTDANSIGRWLTPGGMGVGKYTDNTLFIACMKNPVFRDRFLTHIGERLATDFSSENVIARFQEHYQRIEPALEKLTQKWRLNEMKQGIARVWHYAQERPAKLIGYFRESLNLSDADLEKYFGAAIEKIRESEGES